MDNYLYYEKRVICDDGKEIILKPVKNEIPIEHGDNVFYSCEGCFYIEMDIDCKCPLHDKRYIWSEA